jgi:autotransporter family porin
MSRRIAPVVLGLLGIVAAATVTVTVYASNETVAANAASSCQVTYRVIHQWSGGFRGDVTIRNAGDRVNGWTVSFALPHTGQRITQSWNSTFAQSAQAVTVRNAGWNGSVPANATVNFGFNGAFTDSNPVPTTFAFNGVACGTGANPTTPPTSASPTPSPSPSTQSPAPAPSASPTRAPGTTSSRFTTLPVGAALPSSAQCAALVRATPIAENKGVNAAANNRRGHAVAGATGLMKRVDGDFTGTTAQILRWAACKWGVDEDLVRAQAAIESWWRMDTKGDWGTDPSHCPPGHGLGVDGKPGTCPESYGLLQIRYPFNKAAFPGAATSSAFSVDYAYASLRSCYEGDWTWLNTVERGSEYKAGDVWGCMGVWFSGRWHTAAAEEYNARVKGYHSERIWETRNFQQP